MSSPAVLVVPVSGDSCRFREGRRLLDEAGMREPRSAVQEGAARSLAALPMRLRRMDDSAPDYPVAFSSFLTTGTGAARPHSAVV